MDINANNNEYINADDALSRIGGSVSLYKRLLGRFIDGNHYDKLEQTLQEGNMEEGALQVHSLKGVSANLSLTKISALTVQMEQLLKDGADFSACLGELKQAYSTTAEMIQEMIDSA